MTGPVGGEERLEDEPARGRDPQAAGAEGAERSGEGRAGGRASAWCERSCVEVLFGCGAAPARPLDPSLRTTRASGSSAITPTCGTACAVSTSPTTTISAAPTAAGSAASAPGHRQPRQRAVARTTASPSAVSVAASPAVKATIRTSPSADLVLRDRAEQDDERGRARDQPGRRAHRDEPARARARRGGAWSWWWWSWWCVAAPHEPRAQHAAPTPRTSRPDDQVQPRVQVLGQDYADSVSATTPSAITPAVCVTVTVAPSATACRGVPRVPTR